MVMATNPFPLPPSGLSSKEMFDLTHSVIPSINHSDIWNKPSPTIDDFKEILDCFKSVLDDVQYDSDVQFPEAEELINRFEDMLYD